MPGKIYDDYLFGNQQLGGMLWLDNSYQYRGMIPHGIIAIGLNGQVGHRVVFQKRGNLTIQYPYNYNHIRGKNKPNPPTSKQASWFGKFAKGIAYWKTLSKTEQELWNRKARRAPRVMSGICWFQHHYLLDKL